MAFEERYENFTTLTNQGNSVLACGRIEAIINDGIELYDFAAGKLIALEAGAKVTDLEGAQKKGDANNAFLITNGTQIHDFLVDRVTSPLARA